MKTTGFLLIIASFIAILVPPDFLPSIFQKTSDSTDILQASTGDVLISSYFDGTDTDGWGIYLSPLENPGSGGYGGGENNGFLKAIPPNDDKTAYYIAPNKFHGDWREYDELRLALWSYGGTYYTTDHSIRGDIYLANDTKTAQLLLQDRPPETWELFSVSLNDSEDWTFDGGAVNLDDVLSNITDFQIRAEYGINTDYSGLDNVELFGVGTPVILFLDLPFSFSKHHSLALQNWHCEDGKVESWFDHNIPTFNVTLGNGVLEPYFGDSMTENSQIKDGRIKCYGDPEYCYDDHDGYDFGLYSGSTILAAADGVVHEAGCGEYGYQVIIKHPNNYFTLYGHLRNQPSLSSGMQVSMGDTIGVMGGTWGIYDKVQGKYVCSNQYDEHLHFGVFFDENNDNDWSADEVVDPSGWYGSTTDPATIHGYPPNSWLWVFEREKLSNCGVTGCVLDDLEGDIHVVVPSAYFSEDVQLALFRGPAKSSPQSSFYNFGYSFSLQLLDNIQNTQGFENKEQNNILSDDPITITIEYSDDSIRHLYENSLVLNRWNETSEIWESLPSSVDVANNLLNAETIELGEFDTQAQVLCTGDNFIYDDSYFGAELLFSNSSPISRVFDITEDEDWFRVDVSQGTIYTFETISLAQGVDTKMEFYDIDGVTLLGSNDNGGEELASKLEWISPASGVYFIRVSPSDGSVVGCDASYEIKITATNILYLPIITK